MNVEPSQPGRTPGIAWVTTGFAVLFVASGPLLGAHPLLLGLAFILFGILWSATNHRLGRDPAYLSRLSRSRLWLRRLELGRRRLTDEEWITRDALWQGRLARAFSWFGVILVAAGMLILVRG